jgi:predicted N-acetyltransferase YhbS
MPPEVRPVRDDELAETVSALRAAGLGATVGRLLELPRQSPDGEVFVARSREQIIGGAAVTGFGDTGWIGALGVLPGARRHGAGTLLARQCVDWLREHGVQTVLLYATEAGRPIYERLGFEADGPARAWRDVAPPRGGMSTNGVRPMRPEDLPGIRRLDAAATGEDRSAVLDALEEPQPGTGLVVERGGELAGSALRSPWGLGPSIVAADTEAGLALLSSLRREPGAALTVSLPDANRPAVQALRSWGLRPINQALRMRLGPAPKYVPERVFGLFNLFWG